MVKGFKGFNQDLTCRGFQYEIGKTYEYEGRIGLCSKGFHFCRRLEDVHDFYNLKESRICEIEADGKVINDDTKSVCSRITIIRELSREEISAASSTGTLNTGVFNTGDFNIGDRNTGDLNTGDRNTGDRNTGGRNTGSRNTGDRNTGYFNTGDRNTGYFNTGDDNTGDYNTGCRNSGCFCACDYSSGIFMTKKITYEAFNKQLTEKEYQELIGSEGFAIVQRFYLYSFKTRRKKNGRRGLAYLPYKSSWRIFWQTLTPKQKLAVKKMPHFDADVFYEITGIRVGKKRED